MIEALVAVCVLTVSGGAVRGADGDWISPCQ